MELFNFKDIAPFREPALMFDKYGYYTDAAVDTNEYNRYWDVQEQRCLEGYTVDDIRITGDHYWYLNFSRIDKKDSNEGGKKTTQKIEGFPDFWDGDYIYYHVLDIARNGITKEAYEKLKLPVKIKEEDLAGGKHLGVLKTRRRGYSYKNAALATKYYSLIRKSTIYLTAFEKELFSTIVAMTSQNLNFLSEHTGFGKTRDYINKLTADNFHVEASHKKTLPDGKEIKKGYLSQIKAISFKDDPNSLRGKSASLVLFEEAGSFPILKDAWNITRPSLEDGKFITGTMIAFGCVCKGTKVWTNKGEQINIEELVKEDGIIGYGGKFATKEPIVWMKPPAVKPCYRITTINGNHIECSNDHPLLWSKQGFNKNKENRKTVTFKKAEDIKVGEQLMFIRQIPVFGKERMWNPRLLGLLVGDGYYGNKSTPELSIDSDEVYDWVKGNYSKVTLHKEFDTKLGYKYRSVTLPGSAFELKQIGMYGQTWDNKHLPTNIYSCDIHSITEFIGGYFDADGAITYNKKKNVLRLSLTSKYKHLLEEVKVLLYKLNIGCSIVKENRKSGYKPGEVYRLYIAKLQDVLEFKKHIKFITKRKQDMLDSFDIAGRKGQRTYTNCLFKVNPDVNKGTYYLQDGRNHLDNLDALTVKSVEYIGEKEVYNLNAGMTHTYITNGFISGNTGGDAGSMDFIDMFNNPEPYNMIALENVWSDNKSGTFVSFFAPDYLNRVGFIDTNGNSDWEAAKIYETAERDKIIKTSNDSSVIDKRKAEYPFTPEEAVLSINANKFPVGDLANQLAKLESNRKYFDAEFNGSFIINELNEPEFRIDSKATPIRSFPPRGGEDISGCITIWEHPYKNNDDKVPYGMYVAGIDPVALEEAPTSTSINSTFIFNTMTNTIVAEYSGRLNNSKEYYEQVRRLIKYYNAVLLYENMVTGIFDYFDYKEELYLLADPPQILANLISDSRVKRKKGCHMTPAVKAHGVDLINNWLRDDSNDEGISNVYNIRSTGLLKELINYNKEDNFDRCFIPGTSVLTNNGYLPIEQCIKNKTFVLSDKGNYQIVEETMESNYEGLLINIIPSGQPFGLISTPNHPHLICSNDKIVNRKKYKEQRRLLKNKRWESAKNINIERDFLLIPSRKNLKKHNYSFEQLYVLGWYLSDGYLTKQGCLKICFQGDQLNMAEKVKKCLESFDTFDQHHNTKKPTIKKEKNSNCYILSCTSREFNKLCSETITLKNTCEKVLNEKLFQCDNLLPLIVGYLEGDGHQKQTILGNSVRDTIECTGTYQELIKQIRQILLDNDIWSTCNIVKEKFNKVTNLPYVMKHCKEQLRLDIQDKKGINKIAKLSLKFNSVIEKPQKEFFIKTEDGWWIPIKKIEYVNYKGKVYNLEVSNDHSYTANNIATHNCFGLIMTLIQSNETRRTKEDPDIQVALTKNQKFFHKRIFTKTGGLRTGTLVKILNETV